jgi:hypothetical protein
MSSEGPYGRQGFQSNPSGYGSSGGDYTQQPVYGYGGGGGYGAPPPPPSSGGYDYNNPYGGSVDVSSFEVCLNLRPSLQSKRLSVPTPKSYMRS